MNEEFLKLRLSFGLKLILVLVMYRRCQNTVLLYLDYERNCFQRILGLCFGDLFLEDQIIISDVFLDT